MTFLVPNTLSAHYDICAIVLPQTIVYPDQTFKPCKFNATINYVDEKGAAQTLKSKSAFQTDPTRIDTVVLAENFYFPACNYRQTNNDVTVKLQCQITAKENMKYSREMYLDCIYLRPRLDESNEE